MNVNRLKAYKAKLIVLPTKGKKQAVEGVTSSAATFPIEQVAVDNAPRAITEEGKNFGAYKALRAARSEKKYFGVREKRTKEKAEAEADKKKK